MEFFKYFHECIRKLTYNIKNLLSLRRNPAALLLFIYFLD